MTPMILRLAIPKYPVALSVPILYNIVEPCRALAIRAPADQAVASHNKYLDDRRNMPTRTNDIQESIRLGKMSRQFTDQRRDFIVVIPDPKTLYDKSNSTTHAGRESSDVCLHSVRLNTASGNQLMSSGLISDFVMSNEFNGLIFMMPRRASVGLNHC